MKVSSNSTPELKQGKILIVDDDPKMCLALKSILSSKGYSNLLVANSGKEAIALMEKEKLDNTSLDALLMDFIMPELNGIETCKKIKSHKEWSDIPIIMVTGVSDVANLQAAFEAGAIDYLTKPVNQTELIARVGSVLKLKWEMDARKERERKLKSLSHQLIQLNSDLQQTLLALDKNHKLLQKEQDKSEHLLLNILPKPIAERLKEDEKTIADGFAEVTVLFSDLVGFTKLSSQISAQELVAILNQIFFEFDSLTEKNQLEKIKTIGDAYMVVGGLPIPRKDHAHLVASMGLDMVDALARFRETTGREVHLRIGIHSGPVVAGVIGKKKFVYDLWGDTVNIASRMESHGIQNQIQISEDTYHLLQDDFHCEERGIIPVKGKGEMKTYILKGKK